MKPLSAIASSRVILATAATAVAALLTLGVTRGTVAHSRKLNALAVVDGHRIVEPRLSVPFRYAPLRRLSPLRVEETSAAVPPQLLLDALAAPDQVDAGLARLLAGQWNEALQAFGAPRAAAHPLDVAAAYYMRGLETRSILDFGQALQALHQAGDGEEVLFNRALILEQLSDREAAAEQWRRYLEKDDRSGWATEARQHRAACLRPTMADRWRKERPLLEEAVAKGDSNTVRELVKRYPLASRRLVELELLPAWARAALRGDDHAATRTLDLARAIVEARRVRQERVLASAIEEIDAAPPPLHDDLVQGWATYGAGVEALDRSEYERTLELFARARKEASAHSSALEAILAPATVTALYLRYDYAGAESLIASTRARYAGREDAFLTLFARLDWLGGVLAIAHGRTSESLQLYRRALAVYELLGETDYQAAQHINQADSYSYLADREQAARHVRAALTLASNAEDPKRLHGILKVAARMSLESSAPAAALAFQDRLVRLARTGGDRWRIADALVARSATRSRAGETASALEDLHEVVRLAPSITDGPTRERLLADADSAEAFAYRDRDPARELASLSRAIDRYRALKFPLFLAQLYLERGRMHTRSGDSASAEKDFRAGVRELEEQRALVEEEALRISYFDEADRNFVELAELLMSRGELREAFDLLERSRSRELLDRRSGGAAQPAPLTEIQSQLDDATVIITQTAASDGVLTFVVSRNGLRAFRGGVDEAQLEEWIGRIDEGFAGPARLPRDVLRRLGALLIDPLNLPSDKRLVFVPDRILYRVPSAALLLADGRYLMEVHTITDSPSATMAAGAVTAPATGAHAALIVASPERPEGHDQLPPLANVRSEAARVSLSYGRSRLLLGADFVDAQTLWSQASGYDVLHFAGHAVVDARNPSRSSLLVGSRGAISGAEIARADLSHLSLVVLGGCNTGLGKSHRSEGAMSLARAFLAASVPAVVATTASIEDQSAERMFGELHRIYALRGDASIALREAQLQMLHSSDPENAEPARWAAYKVIGGSRRIRGGT
jgi:CHAT domain-containing protein